jgi:hypothetical protein
LAARQRGAVEFVPPLPERKMAALSAMRVEVRMHARTHARARTHTHTHIHIQVKHDSEAET